MSNNHVNYQVALVPENATLIDKINALILGGTAASTAVTQESTTAETSAETSTLAEVKTAAKAAKKEHGEDFIIAALQAAGGEGDKPAKQLKSLDEENYATAITLLEAGPQESDDDDLGDDDDDFGDDADVDPEAVATAVKAYAKSVGRDEAKALMKTHGCKNSKVSEIADLSAKQLAALFAACDH